MTFQKRVAVLTALLLLKALSVVPTVKGTEIKKNEAMPAEYSVIQEVVNRIQKYNNLRNIPLTFTIVNGAYGQWKAEELGLCKDDKCQFYDDLNPFGHNGRKEREIIRQSYLFGDIEASAYTNGTISISHSTFRILQGKDNFLACLLAHEISHVITHDLYERSKLSVDGGFDSDSEEDQLKKAEIRQKQELDADRDAIIMVANSGFPRDSCERFEVYLAKSTGIVAAEDPVGTHPSYKRRLSHSKKVTASYLTPQLILNNKPREWHYSKVNNYLFLKSH